jgi:hypothetical protein
MTAYYIDPVFGSNTNAGTSPSAPIQTPYKAGFLSGLVAGDVVRFKRGTTLTCTTRIDGNVSGVSYRSYYNVDGSDDTTQLRPIIDGNGVRQIWGLATDRTGIKFYDLDFTNWGDGGAVASFAIANATTGDSNSIVTGVEVHSCRFYGSNAGTAETSAIHLFGADCVIEGNEFWDISDDAIWVKGDRAHIYDNRIERINTSGRNVGDCIQLGGRCDDFSVHDNYLDGSAGANKQCFIISGASAGTGGVFEDNECIGGNNTQTCVYSDQPGTIIRRNRCVNGAYSIYANAEVDIYSNLCESTYPQDGAIYLTAAGCEVYNNTVLWTGAGVGGSSGTGSGIYMEAGQVSTARNNILIGCGRGIRLDETVASESYNVFYNCTSNVKGISSDPALGTGSRADNPNLDDAHMPRDPVVWTGGTSTIADTDYNGVTFPFPPTIGAIQYTIPEASAASTTEPARVDYWGIEQEIAEIIRANTSVTIVAVEEEMLFGAESTPWVGVYLDKREVPPARQTLSGGTRTRMQLTFSLWVWCFSLDLQEAIRQRDYNIGVIELALMAHRTLNETVDTSWLAGGRLPSARVRADSGASGGFVSGGEILLVADVVASN